MIRDFNVILDMLADAARSAHGRLRRVWDGRSMAYAGGTVLLYGVFSLALVSFGLKSLLTSIHYDSFIMLDGAYRILHGQIPHLDFQSALGALTYALPAATFLFSDSFGPVVPVMSLILFAFFVPIILYVLLSRYSPSTVMLAGFYLVALVLAPMNMDAGIKEYNIAAYYNRVCWAALSLVFMLYVSPHRESRARAYIDALCIASLFLFMFYVKITYAAFGACFVAFLFSTKPSYRKSIVVALALSAASMAAIEALWGLHAAYFNDIRQAMLVSSPVYMGIARLAIKIVYNAENIIFFAAAFFMLWIFVRPDGKTYFYFLFVLAACVLIQAQNSDRYGFAALMAPIAAACELAKRSGPARPENRNYGPLIMISILLAFTVRPVALRTANLILYAYQNNTIKGTGLPDSPLLRGVSAFNRGEFLFEKYQWGYIEDLNDGTEWLRGANAANCRVFHLSYSNPFPIAANLEPPLGGSTWFHIGRNFDSTTFIPAESLFRDADIVMVQAASFEKPRLDIRTIRFSNHVLLDIYGPYLFENFKEKARTSRYVVYVREKGKRASCGL